jgi:hypothetical protein
MRRVLVLVALLAMLGGCAGKDTKSEVNATGDTHASTTSTTHAAAQSTFTTTLVNGKPHFATAEDAMRFLADAWNRDDIVNLKHVTDPGARDELETMHGVAVNLRLNHCVAQPEGDYLCHFDHDYPPHASTTMVEEHHGATGEAIFRVGPADTPGWYMTVFESCS